MKSLSSNHELYDRNGREKIFFITVILYGRVLFYLCKDKFNEREVVRRNKTLPQVNTVRVHKNPHLKK